MDIGTALLANGLRAVCKKLTNTWSAHVILLTLAWQPAIVPSDIVLYRPNSL